MADDFEELLKIIGIVAGIKILADAFQHMRGMTPEKNEINRLFTSGQYKASVVMSLIALENKLKILCQNVTSKNHSKDDFNTLIEILKENKVIDNEAYHQLHYFRNMRNSIFHSQRMVSRDEAQSLINLIFKIL